MTTGTTALATINYDDPTPAVLRTMGKYDHFANPYQTSGPLESWDEGGRYLRYAQDEHDLAWAKGLFIIEAADSPHAYISLDTDSGVRITSRMLRLTDFTIPTQPGIAHSKHRHVTYFLDAIKEVRTRLVTEFNRAIKHQEYNA